MSKEHKFHIIDNDGICVASATSESLANIIKDAFDSKEYPGTPFVVRRNIKQHATIEAVT